MTISPTKFIRDLTNPDFFEQLALGTIHGRSWIYKFGRTQTVMGKTAPIRS